VTFRKSVAVLAFGLALIAQPAPAGPAKHVAKAGRLSLPAVSGPIPITPTSRRLLGVQSVLDAYG